MKAYLKISRITLVLVILTMMTAPTSFGQEGYIIDQDREFKPKKPIGTVIPEDGMRYQDEQHYQSNQEPEDEVEYRSQVKKEQRTKPSPQKKSQAPKKSTDTNKNAESVLSFNFLYYIIQKFKFSDILY